MYQRLEATNRWLESLGLGHRSNLEAMRTGLAGPQPVGSLDAFADRVEPVKGYERHKNHYPMTFPLDRLVDAMIAIREEIRAIEEGKADRLDNVLVNAPHTAAEVTADEWHHPYSRKNAAYPAAWIAENKFWPFVKRVDNAFGDRNLICTCPDMSAYEEEVNHV